MDGDLSVGQQTNFLASHSSAFENPTHRTPDANKLQKMNDKPVIVEYGDGDNSKRIETVRGSKAQDASDMRDVGVVVATAEYP